ncbi:hypothetical protein L6164_032927 [Bauhinia variegata]|uniref:Uncharacterized protein n=1 Tax=Bauhinia variegata TaxID=167791 RepID=A0ACB9KQ67_BAUVA|nr:hypothetical protein L6164_032927 [Bauhinia variegata]
MVKGRQGERVRLYVRGSILGYKRSKSNQYPNTSLIQIEGVNTPEEVAWYAGKRLAYIYKAKINGSKGKSLYVSKQYIRFSVVDANTIYLRLEGNCILLLELDLYYFCTFDSSSFACLGW